MKRKMVLAICAPISLQYFKLRKGIICQAKGDREVPSIEAQINYLSEKPELAVHVLTLEGGLSQAQEITYKNITFHVLPAPKRFKLATLYFFIARTLANFLKRIEPDVVEAHWTYEYALGALFSGLPAVIRVHDWMDNEFKIIKRADFLLKSWIQKYVLKKTQFLIGDTPYITSLAKPYIKGRAFNIPNMVFPEYYEIPESRGGSKVLYLGGISQRKNISILLEAGVALIGQQSNFRLALAGPNGFSSKAYQARVEVLLNRLVAEGAADNLGMIDYQGLVQEMATCAFLVHPSREESFGMTIAEAQAAGRPVVAGRNGGVEYLVADGETGFLVDPDDLPGFIRAMRFLLEEKEARICMGRAARNRMRNLLDPEKIFQATMEVYRLTAN